MSQDQWILLLFKIVLCADVVATAGFVAVYWRLTRGGMWRNQIGRTIAVKDILLVLCLLPSIMSLFFHFSRLTSHVAAWIDVALFGLIAPVMCWRIIVWARIHREKRNDPPSQTIELEHSAPAMRQHPGAGRTCMRGPTWMTLPLSAGCPFPDMRVITTPPITGAYGACREASAQVS